MTKQTKEVSKHLALDAKTLNESLLDVFNKLKQDVSTMDQAKELANVAGKIIKLNMGRMEYNQLSDSKKVIEFWED